MPRIVVDEDGGPSSLGHIDPVLLPYGEVVSQDEAPIAAGLGDIPDLPDLALILDVYAPAPAPTTDQEVTSNGPN